MTKFSPDQEKTIHEKRSISLSHLNHIRRLAFVVDLKLLKIVFTNKQALDALGHDKIYIYKSGNDVFKDILHPEDYALYVEELNVCGHLEEGESRKVQIRLKTKDGGYEKFSFLHVPHETDDAGNLLSVLCLGENIEKKDADPSGHKLLNILFDTPHHGTFVARPEVSKKGEIIDFSFQQTNATADLIFGRNVSGESFNSLFPSAWKMGLFDKLRGVALGDGPMDETMYYAADGLNDWLHFTGVKMEENIVITIADVTQSKHTESSHQTLLEHSTEMISRWNGKCQLLFANSGFASKIGASLDDVLGKTNLEMGQPEDIAVPFMEKVKKTFKTGEIQDHYNYYPTPEGIVYYHSRLIPEYGPEGKVKTVLSLSRDIKELKESRELLHSVFDAAMNGILILESIRDGSGMIEDFKIIMQNKVSAEKYGKNIIGERFGILFPSMKQDNLFDQLVAVVETGRVLDTEKLNKKLAHDIWYRWSAVKMKECAVLFFEDITKRKRAELDLKEEQDKLEEANELMNIVFTASKAGLGRTFFADDSIQLDSRSKEIIGLPREMEVTGRKDWLNKIHPADRQRVIDHSEESMKKGKDFYMEYRVIHEDGSIHYVLGAGRYKKNYQGRVLSAVGMVLNVDDLKRAEEKIKEDAHFIQKIAETNPDIIMVFDLIDGRVNYLNRSLEALTGFSSEDLEKMNTKDLLNIIHEDDHKKFIGYVLSFTMADDGDIKEVDYRIITGKNGVRHIHSRGKIFKRNDKGEVVQVVSTLQDVTDSKKTLDALIESERLSLKGTLARTIMHEVRGPLNNIGLALEVLQEEVDSKNLDLNESYLDIISRSRDRVQELLTQLLKAREPIRFNLENVDLAGILEESIALAQDRIYLTGLHIVRNYDKGYVIQGMKEKLEIALLNVIINAIEAMEAGKGRLELTISQDPKRIKLSVLDNGCGMNEEEVKRIFESNYTRKVSGMGIGLNNVYGILREHRAKVKILSEPNKGTEFIIYFKRE